MRIVQINAVYGFGSTGRTCRELEQEALRRGDECITFYGTGDSSGENAYRIGSPLDTKLHALCSRVFGLQGYFSRFPTYRLIRFLKAYQPDVVQLRNLHGNYIHLKMLLSYLAAVDVPTVITLHDCFFYTGKCTHYTATGCSRWTMGCGGCKRLKQDNASWFFDRTKKMWRDKKEGFAAIPRLGVVGVSEWITNEARQSFFKSAAVIQRIYNWIDLESFRPVTPGNVYAEYGISQEKPLVISAAAGWTQKSARFQDWISIAEKAGSDMQFIMVGGYDAPETLPANIRHIPYVEDVHALAELYSAAQVYLHTAREDTFGKVIAEALACGTPAVTYRSTAYPELVGPGRGYAVETGNTEAALAAVEDIVKVGKAGFSKNCIAFAKENFSMRKNTGAYFDLYTRLCRMNKGVER